MGSMVFYAMDETYLQKYIDQKNKISAAIAASKYSENDIKNMRAQFADFHSEERKFYKVDESGVAHIMVTGPLEPKPDICAMLFDIEMTTYSDIIKGIEQAEQDSEVKSVMFHFDTPGGNVVGLFRTADKIREMKKPKSAMIGSLCASAGYALCSQIGIGNIFCENISSEVGSIGILIEAVDDTEAMKLEGLKRYILRSENAPDKRPEISKETGRNKLIDRLNSMETVFYAYISEGRKISSEYIAENYGRGGVLIAKEALQIGMIDGIITDVTNLAGGQNATVVPVDVEPGPQEATAKTGKDKQEINAMEITEQAFNDAIEQAAQKAAAETAEKMNAKYEAETKTRAEDEKRHAEFKQLYDKFPNQKAMIDSEIEKENAQASADFVLKLMETENARVSALAVQKKAAEESTMSFSSSANDDKNDTVMSAAEYAAFVGYVPKSEVVK